MALYLHLERLQFKIGKKYFPLQSGFIPEELQQIAFFMIYSQQCRKEHLDV